MRKYGARSSTPLTCFRRRIEAFLQLPLDDLDRTAQWRAIMGVGEIR
jgi:hypothetical protein